MTITGRTAPPAPPVAPAAAPPRADRRPVDRWVDLALAAGLVLLVAGTFLPWLRSGTVERSSYRTDGVIRDLLDLNGVAGAVLMAWPFLSLLCAVALGLLILRLPRTGTALAVLCALAAGAVSVPVLLARSPGMVAVAATGPAVTLAGCVVVLAAATTRCVRALSRRSRRIR